MSSLPVLLDAAAVTQRLTMRSAVDALHDAFSRPAPKTPQRLHLTVDAVAPDPVTAGWDHEQADLLVMPAAADGWAGVKMVGVVPGNPGRGLPQVTASYLLFGPPGLIPVAVMDGAALTGLRTAAVSALATRLAARPDSREVVIVGSGVQGRWHAIAMDAILEDARITLVTRDVSALEPFVATLRERGCSAPVRAGDPDAIARADVVCLCTSSAQPVVELSDLAAGVHINAVGAHRPDRRELTADAVAAARVLVGTRASAMTEKGDLILAEAEGTWERAAIVADLHEAASGRAVVRTSEQDRTLFASVGHAYEDLVVARAVFSGS